MGRITQKVKKNAIWRIGNHKRFYKASSGIDRNVKRHYSIKLSESKMELNTSNTKDENTIEEDIKTLKKWLMMQPHLPQNVGEEILSVFVRGTKSLEIAKQKVDAYFTKRVQLPQFFAFSARDATGPYFKDCSKSGEMFFLPKPTPDNCRIIFCSMTESFEEFYDHDQTTAAFLMALELGMLFWPDMRGLYVIGDMECFAAGSVRKLRPASLEASLRCFQECYPLRLKGAVIFNAPSIIDILYNNIIKPFLPEKLFKRVTITSDDKSCLKKYIPEELLPSNYGGKEKSSFELNEDWLNLLVEKRDWFEMTSRLVADDSKRLSARADPYGIDGTFRRLAID